jgi:protein SCO1/2
MKMFQAEIQRKQLDQGKLCFLSLLLFLFLTACSTPATEDNGVGFYEGTMLDGPAADFQLLDQNGEEQILSAFQGKTVLLSFMDSRCVDACPLTALHLRQTSQAIGEDAQSVIFLAVNVNAQAATAADLQAVTESWYLDEIPNWYFLGCSSSELEAVWQAYGIEAMPMDDGSIAHSPGVFLIDQSGELRWYISSPFVQEESPAPSLPLSEMLIKHIRDLINDA